jgi:hypothetical protein
VSIVEVEDFPNGKVPKENGREGDEYEKECQGEVVVLNGMPTTKENGTKGKEAEEGETGEEEFFEKSLEFVTLKVVSLPRLKECDEEA